MNHPDGKIEVLFPAERITARVAELARTISADYRGMDLILVAVLKGSFIFLSDLARHLSVPASIEFVKISSYGTSFVTSGRCDLQLDVASDISGRHVLVVEDIVDTGNTLAFIMDRLAEKKPASLKVCALLHKEGAAVKGGRIDYAGFQVGDVFVAGYGLDYKEGLRGLPYICTIVNREA